MRSWSKKELYKFDDILCKHANNTFNEQMMWEICNNMYEKHLYRELYDEFVVVNKEYQLSKQRRMEMEMEFNALKKRRLELYNTLVQKKDKLNKFL